jgi:hypothetical protein
LRSEALTTGNSIGGVMVSVLVSIAVDRGFKPQSGQTKDYNNGICCFSANHAALRRKSKDLLARNQDNVSEWSDMSIRRLLFQRTSTIKSNSTCCQLGLRTKRTSSSSHWKLTCSRHIIAEKIAEMGLNNNHPFTH